VPVAPLVVHGSVAAALALLVGDSLPPYAYALFMLSLALGLIALPLLGDFGFLLRADPAREWIEAQPVRAIELRLARTMILLVLVMTLAGAALLPIAVFAPSSMGVGARVALFAAGLGQAFVVAGLLLACQSVLGRRAEAALVLLQTVLVGGVIVGCMMGLQLVPALKTVTGPESVSAATACLPSSWFATSVVPSGELTTTWRLAPWIALVVALAILFAAPQSTAPAARGGGWLSFVLRPLRVLVARTWVRREERGSFDLVFDALPLEREFVLRSYPMIAIPLAMLFAGSSGTSGFEREGLLAVLLFTPATYLPILLVYVPASNSFDARWILDGAPVARSAIDNGALKAVAVRFLFPLYVVLFGLAWSRAGLGFATTMAPIGFLVSLAVLRGLYPMCVSDVPLSTDPEAIVTRMDWTGKLMTVGIALTVVAILAQQFVTSWTVFLVVFVVLVLLEWNADRRVRAQA